jgi:hypothetical protein
MDEANHIPRPENNSHSDLRSHATANLSIQSAMEVVSDADNLDQCRIFIVPADIVSREVLKSHIFWHKHLRRDGLPLQDTGHVAIWWLGNDTEKSISRNFAVKWKQYEDAWILLEE